MLIILLLTLLSGFASPDQPALLDKSKQQAEYYMDQIKRENKATIYYWGLLQLSKGNLKIDNYVSKKLNSSNTKSKLLESYLWDNFHNISYHNFHFNPYQKRLWNGIVQTSDNELGIALLLTIKRTNKRKKVYKYLQDYTDLKIDKNLLSGILNNQLLTSNDLSIKDITFKHFLFFFCSENNLISSDLYTKIATYWSDNIKPSFSSDVLENSVIRNVIFKSFYTTNQYSSAYQLYDQITQDYAFPNSKLKLQILRALDYTCFRLGFYDKSLSIQRNKSIPLAQFLNLDSFELSLRISHGAYLYKIGELKNARKTYQDIINDWDNSKLPISSIYNNLSLTYYKAGDVDKYIHLQLKALDYAKNQNNFKHILEIYKNLYIYYKNNKETNKALEYLIKSRDIAQSYGNYREMVSIEISLSSFYKEFQVDYKEALNHLHIAKKLLDKEFDFELYVRLLHEYSEYYKQQNQFKKAISYQKQILNEAENKNESSTYLEALIELADLNLKSGNIKKARNYVDEIFVHSLDQLDFNPIVKAHDVQARLYRHDGNYKKALSILKPTVDQVIERAKNSTNVQSGYWQVESEYINVFQETIELYLRQKDYASALKLMDRIKTINDASFYQNPMIKSNLLSEKELTRDKQLTDQLDALRKQYLNADKGKRLELEGQIDQLSAQKRSINRKLVQANEEDNDISISDIQRRLPYDHLIILISKLNDTFYIASLTTDQLNIRKIPLTDQLKHEFSSSLEHLARGNTNLNDLYKIYQKLDLEKIPPYIKSITLIPDSYLYQLPLDVLPTQKPEHNYSFGSTHYMVEKYQIHYLTTLQELYRDDYKKNFKNDFVGFGLSDFKDYTDKNLVPLPFATTEVQKADHQLTHLKHKKIFLRDNATKNEFKSVASNAKIIHLATHSEVSNRDPLFSTIYLHNKNDSSSSSDSKGIGGRVFAYELFEMNLTNDLIMMNSCESGSGPYLQGTGVMGISRALRYAGAQSLVLNLWSVNDKLASEYAVQFYHALNNGDTKAQAMQKAKLYFLKNSNANPHYWGPYMLLGNPSPILKSPFYNNPLFIGGFMLILLAVGGIIYRNRNHRPV